MIFGWLEVPPFVDPEICGSKGMAWQVEVTRHHQRTIPRFCSTLHLSSSINIQCFKPSIIVSLFGWQPGGSKLICPAGGATSKEVRKSSGDSQKKLVLDLPICGTCMCVCVWMISPTIICELVEDIPIDSWMTGSSLGTPLQLDSFRLNSDQVVDLFWSRHKDSLCGYGSVHP